MADHLLVAVWPILDHDRTQTDLIAEAQDLLPEVAEQANCVIICRPAWEVKEGSAVAGWGAVDLVLVCTVPANRLGEKRRHGQVTAHLELIRRLAGDGWTDARIADRIGCSESGVAKARVRARPPIPPGVGNPVLRLVAS